MRGPVWRQHALSDGSTLRPSEAKACLLPLNRSPSAPGPASAFTLIELVLVLVIVALVAVLAIPVLARAHRATWEAPAYRLMSTLRQARYHAITSGEQCAVVLEPTGDGLRVRTLGPAAQGERQPIKHAWAEEAVLPFASDTFEHLQPTTIEFTPSGVDRTAALTLRKTREAETRIEIRRPSGLVWLVTAPAKGQPDAAAGARAYWESHLRNAR